MPIMDISIVPIGTKTTSISKYIASTEEVLAKSALISQITAMGTVIEAESLEKLLDIAAKMHKRAFKAGAKRVLTNITIDDRMDKKMTLESKVKSVKEKIRI